MIYLSTFELGVLLLNAFFLGAIVGMVGIQVMLWHQRRKIEKNTEEWSKGRRNR